MVIPLIFIVLFDVIEILSAIVVGVGLIHGEVAISFEELIFIDGIGNDFLLFNRIKIVG